MGPLSSLDVILTVPVHTPWRGPIASSFFGLLRSTPYPRIVCADGTTLSVQASAHTYCTPRNDAGPWTAVEVGFPSVAPPESWQEYCEEWENPTDTVYGYVPAELVREFITAHGGEK